MDPVFQRDDEIKCNSKLLTVYRFLKFRCVGPDFLLDIYAHYAYKYLMVACEVIRRLEKAGFVNKGGRNHDKLTHPDGRVTIIHRHKGDIPLGTLKAIERQTKVKLT